MRMVTLTVGLTLLAAAWLGPLPGMAAQGFHWHMVLHMTVVAVASPLVAVGLAGSTLDPVARRPRLFHPVVAAMVEMAVVWGWHAPGAHQAARTSTVALVMEQGSFLGAGVLVWLAAFGGSGVARVARAGAGIVGLLLTSMHMTFLGALIGLSPQPLYRLRHGGPSTLAEQQLGGAVMLAVGGLSYLIGGLALVGRITAPRRGAEVS